MPAIPAAHPLGVEREVRQGGPAATLVPATSVVHVSGPAFRLQRAFGATCCFVIKRVYLQFTTFRVEVVEVVPTRVRLARRPEAARFSHPEPLDEMPFTSTRLTPRGAPTRSSRPTQAPAPAPKSSPPAPPRRRRRRRRRARAPASSSPRRWRRRSSPRARGPAPRPAPPPPRRPPRARAA